MKAIFPITSLQKNVSEVKDAAQEQLVHITENGRAAYVFTSEETLDDIIEREREQAVFEARLMDSIDRGIRDLEEGRYHEVDDAEELMSLVRERRAAWSEARYA